MMQLPKKLAWAFEMIVSWQRLLFNQRNLTWIEDFTRWRKHCYLVIFPPFQIRFSRKTLKCCLFVSAMCARFCSPHIIQELLLLKCGGWRIRPCWYSRPCLGIKRLFQLRVGLSALKSHKYRHNFQDTQSDLCDCRTNVEDTEHYLLHCPSFLLWDILW